MKLIHFKAYQFFIYGGVFIKRIVQKRIICFILVTSLLVSTITLSYSNSISIVKAETTTEKDLDVEGFQALCGLILGVVGGTVGGGIGAVVGIVGAATAGYNFGSYIADNGDGTITINGELIQAVIDEFEKYEKINGFSDGDTIVGKSRIYYFSAKSMSCAHDGFTAYDSYYNDSGEFTSSYRVGGYFSQNNEISYSFHAYQNKESVIYCNNISRKITKIYDNGNTVESTSNKINSSNTLWISMSCYEHHATIDIYCNFPVFSNKDACMQYLNYGDNYKDALNYVEHKPTVRRASFYSPTYNGGNITVNKNKLPNVINKIDELNNDNPDDTDTVINNFITWLYTDDEPETETETPIEPDTSEVGDDLTETNGWLQKIYNRIGEFMNSFSSQKNKLNKLLESKFDELITAVKNIGKSDEPETEPETENETETETSTDKTDIIIENQEKSQGILESILTAIQDGFKDTVNELKKIRRWTALDTIFDGLDAVADWLDFVTKFFDNVTDGIGLLVSGFTDTITELTKVFPFSIPITLVLIVQMFSAPPEPPKFELPLKLDAFNIDEKIVIDLSQFQVISVISRTFLTIIYCVGLYHLTFKIVTAKKGG